MNGRRGAARIQRLSGVALAAAEAHGKRLDAAGKARAVFDQPALSTTGLDLGALHEAHVDGAKVQKSQTKALHLILQFPKELVDGENAEDMLKHARAFAEALFGNQAVFADRIDRDEKSRHVVDLFLAPRYQKVTKRQTQTAVSTSKHLKELAATYEKAPNLRGQGQALQDAWFEYLRDEMRLRHVQRGAAKKRPGDDWLSPEELDLQQREAALQAREEAITAREEAQKVGMLKRLTKRDPSASEQLQEARRATESAQKELERERVLRDQEVKEARLWASQRLSERMAEAERQEQEAHSLKSAAYDVIDTAKELRQTQERLSRKNLDQAVAIERLEVQNRNVAQQVEQLLSEKRDLTHELAQVQGFQKFLIEVLRSQLGSRWEAFREQVNAMWSRDARNPDARPVASRRPSGPSGP